jgi:catechol 2,3-dioxygenase-like lactoylglutathione lyase family enzyme
MDAMTRPAATNGATMTAAGIKGLDHWAIVTGDEAKCTSFYQGVLGLKIGPRPQLTFKGVWFYSGDVPIVHVISDRAFQPGQTGAFDHIAFAMEGSHKEMEHKLAANNVAFQSRLIERTGVYQIACKDPDGCGVELNFQGVKAA